MERLMASEHPVRVLLKLQGKSEGELADSLNISRAYFSYLLNGKKPITEDLAQRLSKATGIPFVSLIRWDAVNRHDEGEPEATA
jgi:transcriptional regulator with XRE-family HTH domain